MPGPTIAPDRFMSVFMCSTNVALGLAVALSGFAVAMPGLVDAPPGFSNALPGLSHASVCHSNGAVSL